MDQTGMDIKLSILPRGKFINRVSLAVNFLLIESHANDALF